jgi:Ca2+-binding RTX toxin-like protein
LAGGQGNAVLTGGASADTYLFNRGDGQDTVYDLNRYGSSSTDTLVFGAGIVAADVAVSRVGADYVLTLTDPSDPLASDRILIQEAFANSRYRIEQYEFADGTVSTGAEVHAMSLNVHGTEGADTVVGTAESDTIFGYGGDDLLIGGAGNDTYVHEGDFGNDIVRNQDSSSSIDITLILDTDSKDLWFEHSGNDLLVSVLGTDNSITYQDWFSNSSNQVDQIQSQESVLLNSSVNQLVAAMSIFDIDTGVGSIMPAETSDALASVYAETWQLKS